MNECALLTRKQAAEYLSIKENTLAVWACTKRYNLTYLKIGGTVRYRKEDLNDFLNNGAVSNLQPV